MNITEEITDIIKTYQATTIEAHNLPYLMGMRKELSIKAFELGKETARYKKDFANSTAIRKNRFAVNKLKFIEEGNTATKSELLAEKEIQEWRIKEAQYDGWYMGCKIILEQANEVISSIQQDISQLKLEYKNEI